MTLLYSKIKFQYGATVVNDFEFSRFLIYINLDRLSTLLILCFQMGQIPSTEEDITCSLHSKANKSFCQ